MRVAIVSVGAVTSLGPTAADLWAGARDGRVAIEPVRRIEMAGFPTRIGGEVDELPAVPERRPRGAAGRERALDLALVAAAEALAGVSTAALDPDRFGVVLGTCNAGLLSGREWLRRAEAGLAADPWLAALVTPAGLADALALEFGLSGPVLAVNTACASGANAIGLGFDLIRAGRADAVLAGGTDALSDVVFAGFSALESLSESPAAPYSGGRDGLSLGEGSGMLVLMSSELAQRHSLPVLAEVGGYGLSADGYHATAPRPDGSGAAEAMRSAMRAAGVEARQVGYVNGHGTGTPKNDPAETKAIQLALGAAADHVLVSSTKSMIGHLLGAAGAAEAIVTVGALREQVAPPTAGYESRDADCPLDYVPNQHRPMATEVALSNNFAFGGANACVVLTRPRALASAPTTVADTVVVTGAALITPALTGTGGERDVNGVAANWTAYVHGRDPSRLLDGVRQSTVEIDPEPYLSRRERRRMDRLSVLSVMSTAQALAAASLTPSTEQVSGCGIVFGTGAGPMESMERFVRPLLADVPTAADPGLFPNTVYNQAAGQVAMHLGLYGPTSTLSSGHATGAATIGYATDLLHAGAADAMVATVTDTLTAEVARGYVACGLASTRGDHARADGRFALSEGSAALVLERGRAAQARGAAVLGEVLGWGLASDGARGRRGDGLERSMRAALGAAGLNPDDVEEVWLAAAGLRVVDRVEASAVDRVFGTGHRSPVRHAPKLVLGEPIGVGAALCVALALDGGPCVNRVALVNSSSLSGSHVSLVVRRAGDPTCRAEL